MTSLSRYSMALRPAAIFLRDSSDLSSIVPSVRGGAPFDFLFEGRYSLRVSLRLWTTGNDDDGSSAK